jgi:hypothetical protein
MKYLLLICIDRPDDAAAPARPAATGTKAPTELTIDEWVDEMDSRGARLLGNQVRPASEATTVRVRDGEVLLTDGPYAETKEMMAGFDIIDCADLDEALDVAAKHPMAWSGMVEVRPFWTD